MPCSAISEGNRKIRIARLQLSPGKSGAGLWCLLAKATGVIENDYIAQVHWGEGGQGFVVFDDILNATEHALIILAADKELSVPSGLLDGGFKYCPQIFGNAGLSGDHNMLLA